MATNGHEEPKYGEEESQDEAEGIVQAGIDEWS